MIVDFQKLRETVMDIKEEEVENRKFFGLNRRLVGGMSGTKPVSVEVAAVRNQRFSNLGRPLSKIFEKLKRQGLLKPLEAKPIPNSPPPHFNLKLFCYFHQQKGHDTDNCARLRHEIQDLIDFKKIPDPETEQPDTNRNPLPNYRAVPPPTYMISSGLPEDYVLESFHPTAFCLGIWDNSSEGEPELGKNFWLDFSSSDEEEVKGMTRSGRFYGDVADKGKETLTDGR